MAKLQPFKPFLISWRERVLSELRGANLSVWMAHYWRSDKGNKVEMSNLQIQRMTGLSHTTVEISKRWLRVNGWLVVEKAAYRDRITQQWIVAEFTATIPSPENQVDPTNPDNQGTDQPRISGDGTSPDFPVTGNSGSSVDTDFLVDTGDSDPSGLRSRLKEEVEEEPASASSDFLNPEVQTPEEDVVLGYKKHSVEHYLIPMAKEYGLNKNCREEAGKLYDLLNKVGFPDTQLAACIEYHRSVSDPFMAQKISTWSGLFTMLEKTGLIQQFRSAHKLAKKLNPSAHNAAQEKGFGTSAYGAALAKIIEDKKAGKKSNPSHAGGDLMAEALAKQKAERFGLPEEDNTPL